MFLNFKLSHPRLKNSFPGIAVLSILFFTSTTQADQALTLDNLVFVPSTPNEVDISDHEMPKVDSIYAKLLARNLTHKTSNSSHDSPGAKEIREYQQRILAIEEDFGSYSTELIEVLHSLGILYLQQERYEEARVSFAREEFINRIHFGLFSEALIPSVKSQIRALVASDRNAEADEKQQYLLYLMEKCFGTKDPRLLPDLITYAEWSRERFNKTIRLEMSGIAFLTSGNFVGTEAELRAKAFLNLDRASENYVRAINIMVENEQWEEPALYQIETRLIEMAFIQANRQGVIGNADEYLKALNLKEVMYSRGEYARLARDSYHYGIESYKRQLQYISKDPEGSIARYIETLQAFGDWYILFGKLASGKAKYRESYELLAALELSEHQISEILKPEIPVSIPTFTATPHSIESVEQKSLILNPYRGFIDVGFSINLNGRARHVEILDAMHNSGKSTEPGIERRLKNTITSAQFRPRFQLSDQIIDDQVVLRYYYTY